MTRQDKEQLGSIAEVQRGQGRVPVAWSSQGRHHCLRGGEEPPGLSGPVEGQGKREQAREACKGSLSWAQGTWQRQKQTHRTPAVTRFHVVPHVSEPWRDGRGATSAGGHSQVAMWPAGTEGITSHGTGDWERSPEAYHLHTARHREQGLVSHH